MTREERGEGREERGERRQKSGEWREESGEWRVESGERRGEKREKRGERWRVDREAGVHVNLTVCPFWIVPWYHRPFVFFSSPGLIGHSFCSIVSWI